MKRGRFYFAFFALFAILLMAFVFANLDNAPSGITITGNVSALYDEGNFSVNWTYSNATGDIPNNYTIFVWVNRSGIETTSVLYTTAKNNSGQFGSTANTHIAGYTFNNHTEGNYTFFIQALNASPVNYTAGGGTSNATRNISVYVDRTDPLVNFTSYSNGTSKKNTSTLTLNISVTDGLSGVTGSGCIIDINGTNQTVFVSNGWCNTTNGNLTGLTDGNTTIKVYVNDTVGNLVLNDSFAVQIDTTAPSVSTSCSSTSVNNGDALTCSCSRSDATSGVASVVEDVPSTASTGTFTYGCTVTDNAGNVGSASTTYVVEQGGAGSSGGSSGGGGGSTTSFWTRGTFAISKDQFAQGHTTNIQERQRVKLIVNEENHYVGVKDVTGGSVTVEVSSDPQEKVLSVGEEWKVEVTGDNFYDLSVKVNSVDGDKANILVQSISEEMPKPAETAPAPETANQGDSGISGNAVGGEVTESSSLLWLWILIVAAIVILVIVWLVLHGKKRR